MTLLEKILYIADYMEPTRDFPGVELLREVTYRDLDEAVLLGMEMTIQEMEERGQAVHRGSLSGRNFLLDAGVRSVLHPQREKSRKGEKL